MARTIAGILLGVLIAVALVLAIEWVVGRIVPAPPDSNMPGLVVGGFIFVATLYNIVRIPHPIWFVAISLVSIPIVSWLGATNGRGRAVTVTP